MYCYVSGFRLNEEVKTYTNRKGYPVRKNSLKEECAFPDGGIGVQDSIWSIKIDKSHK